MKEQKIVIRRLTPELCKDWLHFFDEIAFKDHGDWAFCYCLEGHLTPKKQEEWCDSNERREKAIEFIQTGVMQGYLAYEKGDVVGWVNTNDRENYPYLTEMFRQTGYQADDTDNAKVRSIFCFLVAPEYRGRGIAQNMLNRICEDARQEGYDYVETYPFTDKEFEFQYHGTVGLFLRNGFTEAADLKFVKVMRKTLK